MYPSQKGRPATVVRPCPTVRYAAPEQLLGKLVIGTEGSPHAFEYTPDTPLSWNQEQTTLKQRVFMTAACCPVPPPSTRDAESIKSFLTAVYELSQWKSARTYIAWIALDASGMVVIQLRSFCPVFRFVSICKGAHLFVQAAGYIIAGALGHRLCQWHFCGMEKLCGRIRTCEKPACKFVHESELFTDLLQETMARDGAVLNGGTPGSRGTLSPPRRGSHRSRSRSRSRSRERRRRGSRSRSSDRSRSREREWNQRQHRSSGDVSSDRVRENNPIQHTSPPVNTPSNVGLQQTAEQEATSSAGALSSSVTPPTTNMSPTSLLSPSSIDPYPYWSHYPLHSVVFTPDLDFSLCAMIQTAPEGDMPEEAQRQLTVHVPTGRLFQRQYREEWQRTGALSYDSRWNDALHCVNELLKKGIILASMGLQMAYRVGPPAASTLQLQFATTEGRERFVRGWKAAAELTNQPAAAAQTPLRS
jgi:hypothetical protein